MSAAQKGRVLTPETRARISATLQGHVVSDETRAKIRAKAVRHGDARHSGGTTRLYLRWTAMRHRCTNPNNPSWRYYGGKGIQVCDQWDTFPAFKAWAEANGYRDGLSIDRIDPAKDYEPSNCEWVSQAEQGRRSNRTRPRQTHS